MASLMTRVRPVVADPIDLTAAVAGLAKLMENRGPMAAKRSGTRYLNRYVDNLARLSELAGQRGYRGLRGACLIVRETAEALRARGGGLAPQALSVLDTWAELVQWHLELPPGGGATEVLVHFLTLPHWVTPLDQADAALLTTWLLDERRRNAADETPTEATQPPT